MKKGIKRSKRFQRLYEDLAGAPPSKDSNIKGASDSDATDKGAVKRSKKDFVFPSIKALQCFAAVLGYSLERRIPLGQDTDSIEWHIFENTGDQALIYLLVLAHEKKLEKLRYFQESSVDDVKEDPLRIFEEYANGGFHTIEEWMLESPGDPTGAEALINGMTRKGFIPEAFVELDEPDFS